MSALKGAGSDQLAVQRQLKIKVGAARRLLKEHNLYRKEAEDHQRKVDGIVSENGEEWEIKNARGNKDLKRILEESQRMIEDSRDRLERAVQDLQTLVDSVKSRSEFLEDKEVLEAEKVLVEANTALQADRAS